MAVGQGHKPPASDEEYRRADDLLDWMSRQFKRFGDIYQASVYGSNVYVIRDPRYAQYVLRENWRNYKKGLLFKRVALLLGNGLVSSEGELWKTQRRMIQPAFHGEVIGALNSIITTSNVALLRRWERAARRKVSVNVTRDLSAMVLEMVLLSIFGADYEQVAPSFNILADESSRDLQFAQTFTSLGKIVLQLASQRRKKNIVAGDFLGMLMEARDRSGQAMSDRQLANEIKTLIVAGHETTASTLNWAWYLLSQHPETEEKLFGELSYSLGSSKFPDFADLPKFDYTNHVIEEALRLYPPVWLLTRRALKDDQIGDYFVTAGTEIYIPPYFIQRHPDLWDDPDRFNPDRFDRHHSQERHPLAMIPFSAGPRNCIGESLARVEMQIHLMIIAKHLRLRYVESRPIELDAGVNLRSKYDFIMYPDLKAAGNC